MTGRRAPHWMPGYRGTLSVKTVLRGAAIWRTSDGVFRVDADHLLILNHGQDYSLAIDSSDGPIETFCPFFSDSLVREAAALRSLPIERMLDDSPDLPATAPRFVERLRRAPPALVALLARLRAALRDSPDSAPDLMHDLVDSVLDVATDERARIAAVPAVRAATREELYRRVHRARDFAHANLATPLTLAELARAAAMAPHHFHRAFRDILGAPPGRYVTEARLVRAHRLLRETAHSVTEICLRVGFDSLGTFSTTFKRRFGHPPRALRPRNSQG